MRSRVKHEIKFITSEPDYSSNVSPVKYGKLDLSDLSGWSMREIFFISILKCPETFLFNSICKYDGACHIYSVVRREFILPTLSHK